MDVYPINPQQVLGEGAFGKVYRISHEGRDAAVKELNKKSIDNYEVMKREIDMLTLARHRNIVQLYDTAEVENKVYLLMEYVNGGSLHQFLQSQTQIPYSFADGINWMLQAAEVNIYRVIIY